jgi:hypothetical protein
MARKTRGMHDLADKPITDISTMGILFLSTFFVCVVVLLFVKIRAVRSQVHRLEREVFFGPSLDENN